MSAVYCRVQGLTSEKGRKLNGRVGELVLGDDDDDASSDDDKNKNNNNNNDRSGTERMAVKMDGELQIKSIKWENLKIMSDQATHYTIGCAFNQSEPDVFKWAFYDGDGDILCSAGGNTPNGDYATSLHMTFVALKLLLSKFQFDTSTVLHVPFLNAAIVLNKLLAGDDPDLLENLTGGMTNGYITRCVPFIRDAVESLQNNPHEIFVKWSPHQNLRQEVQDRHPRVIACEGQMDANGDNLQLQEVDNSDLHRFLGRVMPAPYSFFPPLPATPNRSTRAAENPGEYVVLDSIFKEIYRIYPHRSIENCFDVIYVADDKGTLQMGSFMNTGGASITEGYTITKALQGTDAVTAHHMITVDPSMFWNILLHFEAYIKKEENGWMVLPCFENAPAKNCELLKKRTTVKDDKAEFLVPPAHKIFSSQEERQETSDRHARIGALLCMIEVKKRFPNQEVSFQVAGHLTGTSVARDVEASLALINSGQIAEATRVLNGGRICGFCGIMMEDSPQVKEAPPSLTCSGCEMVDYCGHECLMSDHRSKHRQELCSALAADRDGLAPRGEIDYEAYSFMTFSRIRQQYGPASRNH